MTTHKKAQNLDKNPSALNPRGVNDRDREISISLRISNKMNAALEQISPERDWSRSQLLREALRLYLEQNGGEEKSAGSSSPVDFPEN